MDIYEAHKIMGEYVPDLNSRLVAQEEWITRHPDYRTFAYMDDERNYEENGILSFESTFNPADPMPSVSDMLTAKIFLAVMMLALHAYEGLSNVQEKEAD
jgi:hypothetical protein